MSVAEQDVPNSFLLDEIRENRSAIKDIGTKIDGKVGRGELFGWLGATLGLAALIVRTAVA